MTPFELIALRAKARRWESKIYNDTALVIADGSLIYFDQTGRLFAHSAPEPSESTRKILTRPRMTLDQLTALSTLVVQLADLVLEEEDAREKRRRG